MGHVGQELRFGRGGLLELDALAAQQLVLAHQLGRGLAHALLEEAGGLLQLLVEPRALQGLRAVVQHGDDGGDLAVLGQDLAREGLHGQGLAALGVHEPDVPPPPLALGGEEQVGDEGGEVGVVGLHAHAVLGSRPRAHGEEALGGRVHHDQGARGVGDEDGIGHGVDDEVEAVALRAHVRLRDAQLAVVLLDLLRGSAQVGDVAQDGDQGRPLARIGGGRAEQLEQEVRPLHGVHEEQLAPPSLLDRALGQGGGEEHVVEGHGATPALALPLARHEQRLRARVGDEDAALGVGEEDGIGHDVEQHPLAPDPPVALGEEPVAAEADQGRREHAGHPAHER